MKSFNLCLICPPFCLSELKVGAVNHVNFTVLQSTSPFCTFLHWFGINWHALNQSECRNCCLYIISIGNQMISSAVWKVQTNFSFFRRFSLYQGNSPIMRVSWHRCNQKAVNHFMSHVAFTSWCRVRFSKNFFLTVSLSFETHCVKLLQSTFSIYLPLLFRLLLW